MKQVKFFTGDLRSYFFIHGVSKFQGGIGNTAGFFDSLGIPGFVAYIVASIELIGGLAVILGLGTRIVSVLFVVIMAGRFSRLNYLLVFLETGKRRATNWTWHY